MKVNEIILNYYQRYIKSASYTTFQIYPSSNMQNFNQNIYFSSKFILSGKSKIGKKAKLQKAKTNYLMWTKYTNKNKLKLLISICLVSPSPT